MHDARLNGGEHVRILDEDRPEVAGATGVVVGGSSGGRVTVRLADGTTILALVDSLELIPLPDLEGL